MSVETLIYAILPSLCVSIIMFCFTHIQNKRAQKEKEEAEQTKRSERLRLSLLMATAKLAYAVAMSMKNGHTNGEVDQGIEQYREAMKGFKEFERELVADQSYDR